MVPTRNDRKAGVRHGNPHWIDLSQWQGEGDVRLVLMRDNRPYDLKNRSDQDGSDGLGRLGFVLTTDTDRLSRNAGQLSRFCKSSDSMGCMWSSG